MVNQIFRDFDQKNLNHFLGQTLPFFGANKYEKKANCGLELVGFWHKLRGIWVKLTMNSFN